jgi:hypothetical protein
LREPGYAVANSIADADESEDEADMLAHSLERWPRERNLLNCWGRQR